MKLLLIDSSIKQKDIVINSLKEEVDYLLISYYTDAYEDVYTNILKKIKDNEKIYEQIALFQHSRLNESYKMLYKEGPITNEKFKMFIVNLKLMCNLEVFDLLACSIYNEELIYKLEMETKINFRASSNFTGNEAGADWILESDNIDIKNEYFTENIINFTEKLRLFIDSTYLQNITYIRDICGNIKHLIRDICGNPINPTYNLKKEVLNFPAGKLINLSNNSVLSNNVTSVFKTSENISYLKSNGSTSTNATNIKSIICNGVYLNNNNQYVDDNDNVIYEIEDGIEILDMIYYIENGYSQCIIFLKSDGTIKCTGDYVASVDISTIHDARALFPAIRGGFVLDSHGKICCKFGNEVSMIYTFNQDISNIQYIYSGSDLINGISYAIPVLFDGTIPFSKSSYNREDLLNVNEIYFASSNFIILKKDGTIDGYSTEEYSNIVAIYPTSESYYLLKNDGTVKIINNAYDNFPSNLQNVRSIYANIISGAALKLDGTVSVWGGYTGGGSHYNGYFYTKKPDDLSSVIKIVSSSAAFAALMHDGTVKLWGEPSFGGYNHNGISANYQNYIGMPADLSDVKDIYSNAYSFLAIKNDNSIITWGFIELGGKIPYEITDVSNVYPTLYGYCIIKNNGDCIYFGYRGNYLQSPLFFSSATISSYYYKKNAFIILFNDNMLEINNNIFISPGFNRTSPLFNTQIANIPNVVDIIDIDVNEIDLESTQAQGEVVSIAFVYKNGFVKTYGQYHYGNPLVSIPSNITLFLNYTNIDLNESLNARKVFGNQKAYAIIDNDNNVKVWGENESGGSYADGYYYKGMPADLSNVETIYSTYNTFAAKTYNKSLYVWGSYKGCSDYDLYTYKGLSEELISVKNIKSTIGAFAILTTNGTIIEWGNSQYGGYYMYGQITDISNVYSNYGAFAALKTDGTVVSWGGAIYGIDKYNYANFYYFYKKPDDLSNVINIIGTKDDGEYFVDYKIGGAFTALKNDGSVVSWGNCQVPSNIALLNNIKYVCATLTTFAALTTTNEVYAWGILNYTTNNYGQLNIPTNLSNVTNIYSTNGAFAALKFDGTVVCWGNSLYGGTAPSILSSKIVTSIKEYEQVFVANTSNGTKIVWGNTFGLTGEYSDISEVYSTPALFIMLKTNGTIVFRYGNLYNNLPINIYTIASITNASSIVVNRNAFVVIKNDGTIATWGSQNYGGKGPYPNNPELRESFTVLKVVSNKSNAMMANNASKLISSFVAIKSDGTLLMWNNSTAYNPLPNVNNVVNIYSTKYAFLAETADGHCYPFGNPEYGGSQTSLKSHIKKPSDLTDISDVIVTKESYTIIKNDGRVLSWGAINWGGECPQNLSNIKYITKSNILLYSKMNVTSSANDLNGYVQGSSFYAIKSDDTLAVWGYFQNNPPIDLSNVSRVYSSERAAVVLFQDGGSYAWGDKSYGGSNNEDLVLYLGLSPDISNIVTIYDNLGGFTALQSNASIISWGNTLNNNTDASNVIMVFSNEISKYALLPNDKINIEDYYTGNGGFIIPPLKLINTYFPTGTLFLTRNGYVSIENINNFILTKNKDEISIIKKQISIKTTSENAPYLIPAFSLKNANNLYLSPMQTIEYKNGMWDYVKNLSFSQQQSANGTINAYTVEVPNFYRDLLITDSNPVESTSDTTALVYDEILGAYTRPVLFNDYMGTT